MEREGILDKVKKTLADAKFQVSVLDSSRPMSFDILARKRNTLLIIKVLTNIDAFSEDAANDLKTLSALLGGSPLIIGEKSSL
ncbi:MAG: transcriptional regulator, partial [Thermoplasmata archaeon]